jgi:hypothetical protein
MFFNNVFVIVSLYFAAKVCKKSDFSGSRMYFFTSSCYLHALQIKDLMNSLLIFAEKATPRLLYVCKLIFNRHLGLQYSIITESQVFNEYPGAKINYTNQQNTDGIHIKPASLLFETDIRNQTVATGQFRDNTVPFFTGQGTLPFDVFAAIFYLISRYEEYLPFEPNQYGQFKATDSLTFKLGFLQKPVVDIWVDELKTVLQKIYPRLTFKEKKFITTFTYDIDVAYAYKSRSLAITAINIIKDLVKLNFSGIKKRLAVLKNTAADPFDTYRHITAVKEKHQHNLIYFFLLGPKNKYNRNLNPYSKPMQTLMQQLFKTTTVGMHPSYYAHDNYLQLQHEKLLLEEIINSKVYNSRQHYLRLIFPTTYENLIQAGITNDYTLGFAELPGFRTGTCTAFNFYNLKTEEETNLTLHPNTFMEGTFIEDLQLSAEAALPLMKQLIDEVKKVNGHLISIWHNHSLSNQKEWAGLKDVHDAIAEYAANS